MGENLFWPFGLCNIPTFRSGCLKWELRTSLKKFLLSFPEEGFEEEMMSLKSSWPGERG